MHFPALIHIFLAMPGATTPRSSSDRQQVKIGLSELLCVLLQARWTEEGVREVDS